MARADSFPTEGNVLSRTVNERLESGSILIGILIFSVAFFLAYWYGMSFHHNGAAPFWPPDAILLSALLLAPRRRWWIFLLLPLPIRLIFRFPPSEPLWFLMAAYVHDSLKALLAATVLKRLHQGTPRLERAQQLMEFFAIAVIATPILSAFAGALGRAALGDNYWVAWQRWFFGDALANLILTPTILFWAAGRAPAFKFDFKRVAEGVLLFAALVVLSIRTLGVASPDNSPTLAYLSFPLLLYAAVRFGPRGAASAMSVIALIAIWAADHGRGPFSAASASGDLLQLQLFLSVTAISLLALAVVLSERRRVAASLRESEERFRNLADTAPVLIWMSDTEKFCTYCNRAWLEFTGREIEQELGHGWLDGVHPADHGRCLKIFDEAFAAREPISMEYRLRRSDGEYRRVLDTGVPRFSADGLFAGYVGSCVDITEIKQAERDLQRLTGQLIRLRDEEHRRIAAELHDGLGQSLSLISSRAHHCTANNLDKEKLLDEMKEISKVAVSAIEEVREIAHDLRPHELDLFGLGAAVNSMIRKVSQATSIEISAELDEVEGLLSPAAETSIYRIIQEGLSNVVKHAGASEARVEIRKVDAEIIVSIQDNGQGISEPTRSDDEESRSGFGLRGIAERTRMLGGTFMIDSPTGGGTILTVRFKSSPEPPNSADSVRSAGVARSRAASI